MPILKSFKHHHPKYEDKAIIQWLLSFHLLIQTTGPIWTNDPK